MKCPVHPTEYQPCQYCFGTQHSPASDGYDRVAIVNDMCSTWRHDYNLIITEDQRTVHGKILGGMTPRERSGMFAMMNQVFEHNVKPVLDRVKNEGRAEALNAVFQINGPSRAISQLKDKWAIRS